MRWGAVREETSKTSGREGTASRWRQKEHAETRGCPGRGGGSLGEEQNHRLWCVWAVVGLQCAQCGQACPSPWQGLAVIAVAQYALANDQPSRRSSPVSTGGMATPVSAAVVCDAKCWDRQPVRPVNATLHYMVKTGEPVYKSSAQSTHNSA